jgi:hypothetical protein
MQFRWWIRMPRPQVILPEHRDGMPEGWAHWLDRIRQLAERKVRGAH